MRVRCLRFSLPGFIILLCAWLGAQSVPAGPAAQTQSPPQQLKLNEPEHRAISSGEAQNYTITLATGQYFHLEVAQQGVPLEIRLFSPDGKELERQENLVRNLSIRLSCITPAAGAYRIEIRRDEPGRSAKDYDIKVDEIRTATTDDQKRIAAERADIQGDKLRAQGTGPSRHEAVTQYEAALASWSELKDQERQANTLSSLGVVYYDLGEDRKALEYWNQELPLHRALGDAAGEGNTLASIGTIYTRSADNQKALEYFIPALEKLRAGGDKFNEGTVLDHMAVAYFRLGQTQKALDYFQQALPLEHDTGDVSVEAATLINTGTLYSSVGDPQKALDYTRRGLDLEESAGDLNMQAGALNKMASLYWQLGEWDQALESQKKALVLIKAAGDHNTEAIILNSMGTSYRGLGKDEKALEYHEAALPILHAAGLFQEAAALENIGLVYQDMGQFEKALGYYQQALKLVEGQNRRAAAEVLNYMGAACLKLGDTGKAMEYWGRAQLAAHDAGDRVLEASVLTGMARAQFKLKNLDEAQARLDSALAMTEIIRTAWIGPDMGAFYASTVRDRYELQVELLMQRHQEAEAFEASERARARSLLQLLTESHADIREGVDPVLLEHERSLQADLRAKSERRIRTQDAGLEKDIDGLTAEYREVEAQIRSSSPRYAALTQPKLLTLAEIQKQLLDSDTLLLEYALGEERGFLWAITSDSFHAYELPARSKLEAAARKAYEQMSTRQVSDQEEQASIVALSRMLMGPVASSEFAKRRLVVVADGALQYIPFATLVRPTKQSVPLVADHEIVSLPSASTLALLRRETEDRKPAPKLVVVLADPVFSRDDPRVAQSGSSEVSRNMNRKPADHNAEAADLERSAADAGLPHFERLRASRREAETIVELAGKGNALEELDFDSSRATVTSDILGQYRIIHIATHGLLNSRNPELSGLVFSLVDRRGDPQNGFLQAQEVYNLKLGADLVVLSACQTALGKEIRGEGLVGLTRGFMYAGVPRVVASLWKVPDQATTELMQKFYRGILQQGLQPAAALRAAQFSMWKESRRSAPYYWAGFTLQGEWQ
jgi:CHAT domain-containing protein/tetratricopeptide (TPR) repeat protein